MVPAGGELSTRVWLRPGT